MGSKFTINGREFNMEDGASINISGNDIIIGNHSIDLSDFGDTKVFNVVVHGNVREIDASSSSVTVNGDVDNVKTVSGSVKVSGEVKGSIKTVSGSVKSEGSISGSVKTVSGSVRSS